MLCKIEASQNEHPDLNNVASFPTLRLFKKDS